MKKQGLSSLKNLNKGNVWDLQENDLFRLWEAAAKDADLKENMRTYYDILRTAFDIEEIKVDKPEVVKKYEQRGYKTAPVKVGDQTKVKWAVKKRAIQRVTDLTYENIHHISAEKLIEVLDRNFGGGWESLPQSIQDIIENGFDISTTTLPKDRLHKPGGMYDKKVKDGFLVLEIPKGTWTEAIFAKVKPVVEVPKMKFDDDDDELDRQAREDEDRVGVNDDDKDFNGDDDEEYDEDKLTEESYRTTYETNEEDLNLEAEDVSEEIE